MNGFEFVIDLMKPGLQINNGSINKRSVFVKGFGSDRAFATDQDKVKLGPL